MSKLEIKAMDGGPNVIMGSFTYVDADGNEQTTSGNAVALCRCGGAANKPFCDGSHSKVDFEAPEVILHLKD